MNEMETKKRMIDRPTCRATLYREISGDLDTPVSILSKLIVVDKTILLESAKADKTYSRFSFLAFEMGKKFVIGNDGVYCNGRPVGDLSWFKNELQGCPVITDSHYGDFSGGYVGYLNYPFVEACGILRRPLLKNGSMLGVFYLVDTFCVYDNYTNKLYLALSRPCKYGDDPDKLQSQFADEFRRVETLLRRPTGHLRNSSPAHLERDIPRIGFMNKVRRIKTMIEEGEAIQVVLSDYRDVNNLDPFFFYRNLRRINPSPYMFFLKDGDYAMVGSSPEVHLRVRGRRAILRPIAGTRRRDAGADLHAVIADLQKDEKEKAEHLMLVDLARNDLSRFCRVGTVEVTEFMDPEVYSHVIHLVSEVHGEMSEGVDPLTALIHTFPAGTVTGAPKTRAIEIIDELEEERRGPYAGCIGYIGFDGNMDMAITIRTAYFHGTKARLQAGAGIVYDSDPAKEYAEVKNKLRALMRSGGIDDCVDRQL